MKNLKIKILQVRDQLKKIQIKKLIALILCISPLLCFSWWWGLSIDDTNEYDFFLFVDHKQKLKWYFHYSAYFLENIIIHYCLYVLSNIILKINRSVFFKNLTIVTEILLYFSIFRLLLYFMFRFDVSIIEISLSLFLISSIITLARWPRNS